MTILKQNLAPITTKAWDEIQEEAVKTFNSALTARRFVGIDGPKGMDFGAVNIGRLEMNEKAEKSGLRYGLHQVQPLVEVRIPFELDIWELDNIERGAPDVDLDPLTAAAKEIVKFEENAIYDGFKAASINGLRNSSEFPAINYPKKAEELPTAIAKALNQFREAAVAGPFSLILDTKKWEALAGIAKGGYPLLKQIERLIEGEIISSPNITGAYLVAQDEDAFKLTLGHDISLGYETHTTQTVRLFFSESFTFQVIEPKAVMILG